MGARFKREGIYAYLWLIYVAVWQKPTQHCKAIILQLKIKNSNRHIHKINEQKMQNLKWCIHNDHNYIKLYLYNQQDWTNYKTGNLECCVLSHSVMSNPVAPWTVACQAALSMGFSRQEDWSGLPCPPPGDLPNPGIKHSSPKLQVYSLPAEPQGNPNNIGMGSLSLLQWIFPTQESNWDLLHCRQIFYHLSHQGCPNILYVVHIH